MGSKGNKKYKLKNWGSISKSLYIFLVISLLLFSTTLSLLLSAKKIASYYLGNTPLTVYLSKEISHEVKNNFTGELQSNGAFKFVEADNNTNSIDIYLSDAINNNQDKTANLIQELQQDRRVVTVHIPKIYQRITTQDDYFLYKIAAIIFIISTTIILALLFLIIRNRLLLQKDTLRNMQLIGATNSYIQEPILFRNFWCALLSGLTTTIIISLTYYYILENNFKVIRHISLNRLYIIASVTIFFGIISVAVITKLVLWCILRNKTK